MDQNLPKSVNISSINTDPTGIQPRTRLSQEAVRSYSEMYESGEATFPAITVALLDDEYRIIDGYHRVAACQAVGIRSIRATVIECGSLAEAATNAARLNRIHGVPMTADDRKSTLAALIEQYEKEGHEYSVAYLAESVGLPRSTAQRVIRSMPGRETQPIDDAEDAPEGQQAGGGEWSWTGKEYEESKTVPPKEEYDDGSYAQSILHDRKREGGVVLQQFAGLKQSLKDMAREPGAEDLARHLGGITAKLDELKKITSGCVPDRVCEACEGLGGDCEVCKGERLWCRAFARQRDTERKASGG